MRARTAITLAEFIFEPGTVVWHKIPTKRLTAKYFWMRCYAEGLSKAYLAALLNSRGAISTERTYVVRSLSRGIAKNLGDAILRRDVGGVGRASAIVTGLLCAIAGFIIGRASSWLQRRHGRIDVQTETEIHKLSS